MHAYSFILVFVGIAGVGYAALVARLVPGLWKTSSRFNSTSDWTPAPEHEAPRPPAGTPLTEYTLGIITPHLESGETLEGFARGFFSPPRPQDWKFGAGIEKLPLVIAATSRRILLFEVTVLTVHRYLFVRHENIRFLRPPKTGFLGTSTPVRFGLESGLEYQLGFLGPLFNDEGMRQERRLADYLRGLAPRYASSRATDSHTSQRAA
jgi:hypothetical protein